MDIKGINNNQIAHQYGLNNANDKSKKPEEVKPKISDKLELSEDAKKLTGDKVDEAKINKIKKRIEIGFYNSDAVISKVAERILNEIG